ncbi:hypothetical protein DENSPDRAFT_752684, partial [Dentipellis sp. KUC8613]
EELPENASPLFILLYADKTRLSSFGTAKGYPVIARIVNLESDIRNGDGVGGGRVVGWIPVVPEDSQEKGKPGWANFKRVVWHKSFWVIVGTIIEASQVGKWYKCADDIQRLLYIIILILSADYEEQCIMSLIRGFGGKLPCPICLVPSNDLSNLSKFYPLRTSEGSKALVKKGQTLKRSAHNKILKKFGLRNIENVFWSVEHMDVHRALSFDRL